MVIVIKFERPEAPGRNGSWEDWPEEEIPPPYFSAEYKKWPDGETWKWSPEFDTMEELAEWLKTCKWAKDMDWREDS